ncbi:MAG: ATP-binding cassette domain-containing protein [Acidimicrobiia bacterium]
MPETGIATAVTSTRTTPAAAVERLWKRYPDGTVALADVSLRVGAAERVLVTGPLGSGTSTLLRILSGRSVPTRGRARVLGVPVHLADPRSLRTLRSRVALLDGALHLPGDATPLEALDVAAARARRPGRRPIDLLDDIGGLAPDRPVRDLDGAERALLGLALVAARRPRLVVADDPWAALDPGQGFAIGRLACRIVGELDAAFVLAGRDAGAVDGIDRAVRLEAGRVVA